MSINRVDANNMISVSNKKLRLLDQLPLHLLEIIVERLSFADCIRLAAVSKSWRSIVKQTNNSRSRVAWLLLPSDQHSPSFEFFDLIEDRIYDIKIPEAIRGHCWGSSKGWLVIAQGKLHIFYSLFDPNIILFNPISGAQVPLPPFVNSELIQIRSAYCIDKIDLLSPPNAVSGNCIVAASFLGLKFVGLCRPEDNHWSVVEIEAKDFVADILFYRGVLYVLLTGNLVNKPKTGLAMHTVTIGDQKIIVKLIRSSIFDVSFRPCPMSSLLVDSSSELLIILEWMFQFKVFKIDESSNRVLEIHGLDDQVLFLTRRSSLSVSTRAIDGMAGPYNNNIFFIHYSNVSLIRFVLDAQGHGVSSPEGEKICELIKGGAMHSIAAWFTPNLC